MANIDDVDATTLANGWRALGLPDGNVLRDLLSQSENMMATIQQFQVDNGIVLPSLSSMVQLLDLLNVPRREFHHSVIDDLRNKLIKKIEEITQSTDSTNRDEKLGHLLEKCFPLIKDENIQPVVMCVLKSMDKIDEKYLKLILEDKEIYSRCDVGVKRHIWENHELLFCDELSPIFIRYIREKTHLLTKMKNPGKPFFLLSQKAQRQSEVSQTFAKLVGKSDKLYDKILQFLRTLFGHTNNTHYCTLRVNLLMEFHYSDVRYITNLDPLYNFALSLDVSMRECNINNMIVKNIDPKRMRKLQSHIDDLKRGEELGDIAMALADPYAVDFLAQSIMRLLSKILRNEGLPRDNHNLHFLMRMLNLGLHAHEIILKQKFQEPKFNFELITCFLPNLLGFMCDDQVRMLHQKLPANNREEAILVIEHAPPNDKFKKFIQNDRIATVILIYYCAQVANKKDRKAIVRVFSLLSKGADGLTFLDMYLHVLISSLIQLGDEFADDELCITVFDDLLLPALAHSSTVMHVMKLIWHIYMYLTPDWLNSIMNKFDEFFTKPPNEEIFQQYKELQQRVQKRSESEPDANKKPEDEKSHFSMLLSATPSGPAPGSESYRFVPPTPSYAPSMSPFYSEQRAGAFTPLSPSPYQRY